MKKLLVIPVLICYLFAVSGVLVHLHYCGGSLESWAMFDRTASCDEGECGDESSQSDACCKDKLIVKKLTDNQNISSIQKIKFATNLSEAILFPQAVFSERQISSYCSADSYCHAPPGNWQCIPLYKLHQQYTYYG